jgi:Tol biopolymer transport system component
VIALLAFVAIQAAAPALDARQITLAAPQVITQIDTGKMKGDLARFAWSPDGSEFYLQMVERDRGGNIKSATHYVVSAESKSTKRVDQEPPWASKYWSWKSGQASPGAAAFKIIVDGPRRETVRSTAAPTGGALAKGGGGDPLAGSTTADVASAADQTQVKTIYALKLKNETLGEWVNEPVTPGVNYSWAPAPLHMIVFAKREGGPLIVFDDAGQKQELSAAKSAFLPAWSDDGKRIAWLERRDRKKYDLTIAEVSAR